MRDEVLQTLFRGFSVMTPAERIVAAELVRLMSGAAPSGTSAGATPSVDAAVIKHEHPDPGIAKNGRKYLQNWKDVTLRALSKPLSRDALCLEIKAQAGSCLPTHAISHLLHTLWSLKLVEMV